MSKLLNISDLSNILGLVDPKTNKPKLYYKILKQNLKDKTKNHQQAQVLQ